MGCSSLENIYLLWQAAVSNCSDMENLRFFLLLLWLWCLSCWLSLFLFLLLCCAAFLLFFNFSKRLHQLGFWAQLCPALVLLEPAGTIWHGAAPASPQRPPLQSLLQTPGHLHPVHTNVQGGYSITFEFTAIRKKRNSALLIYTWI